MLAWLLFSIMQIIQMSRAGRRRHAGCECDAHDRSSGVEPPASGTVEWHCETKHVCSSVSAGGNKAPKTTYRWDMNRDMHRGRFNHF